MAYESGMILPLYRSMTHLSGPALSLMLRWRLKRGKEHHCRLDERKGIATRPRPQGKLLWLHGASVGEALSALVLIDRLLARYDDLHIMVTTGTLTSANLLATRLPERAFHQFIPLDHPLWVRRFLNHWKPDAALWMESELWPNLLSEIKKRNIPAALLNARISEKSLRNWQRFDGTAREILSAFKLCHAQAPYEADGLKSLGAKNVADLGNLKYSSPPPEANRAELENMCSAIGQRPVWLFASTHEGEESMAARLHRGLPKNALTIIAPRHPERGNAIREIMEAAGLMIAQRSRNEAITDKTNVYIADSLGEMGLIMRLAPICVIGGSFVPHGGHNPIEPAQLARAIIHGPHMFNFIEISKQFEGAKAALSVADEAALGKALAALLQDDAARKTLSQAAKALADSHAETVDRVLDALTPILAEAGIARIEAAA